MNNDTIVCGIAALFTTCVIIIIVCFL